MRAGLAAEWVASFVGRRPEAVASLRRRPGIVPRVADGRIWASKKGAMAPAVAQLQAKDEESDAQTSATLSEAHNHGKGWDV